MNSKNRTMLEFKHIKNISNRYIAQKQNLHQRRCKAKYWINTEYKFITPLLLICSFKYATKCTLFIKPKLPDCSCLQAEFLILASYTLVILISRACRCLSSGFICKYILGKNRITTDGSQKKIQDFYNYRKVNSIIIGVSLI